MPRHRIEKKILLLGLCLISFACGPTEKKVAKEVDPIEEPTSPPSDDNGNEEVIPTDSDGDGLDDVQEKLIGTDSGRRDTDGDGLSDGEEVHTHMTNPLLADTDGGGINDGFEVSRGDSPLLNTDDILWGEARDADGDSLSDEEESQLGSDPNLADTDGDGLRDGAEINTFGTKVLDPDTDDGTVQDGPEVALGTWPVDQPSDDRVAVQDSDDDGLSNSDELTHGTDPLVADTDDDGLSDGTEINTLGTDPLNSDSDAGGLRDGLEVDRGFNPKDSNDDLSHPIDSDLDGLFDVQEIIWGTNLHLADSDGDGLSDGAEVFTHRTDPLVADSDQGGESDGDEVGRGANPGDPADDNPYEPLALRLIELPVNGTTSTSGHIRFEVVESERVDSALCAVDSVDLQEFISCWETDGFRFENLEAGQHVFRWVVTDTNGHSHWVEYSWLIQEEVDPCESASVIEEVHLLNFAAQTQTCSFGQGQNLAKKNGRVQAIESQSIEFSSEVKICSIEFEAEQSRFQFDDHFVLSWNDITLATNRDQLLSSDSDFYTFDFLQVRGNRFGGDTRYCLGSDSASNCEIPSHDSGGGISMKIPEEVTAKVLEGLTSMTHSLRLDIIGDNDSSDCQHEGLQVKVRVKRVF